MKSILLLSYFLFTFSYLFSQNVGIGTSNPTRAKLELYGSVQSTSAIFGGESSGISLQSNWPGIGFNQYHNNGHRYLTDGWGAVMYLDPNIGSIAVDISTFGLANATTFPRRILTIGNNGNIGIGIGPTNATLAVLKGINFDGAAVFAGTTHASYFNYSGSEHTYIRAGKNGSKVFINDNSGGNILMGGGNSLVGINSTVPTYPLEIRQVNGKGLALVEPANTFNNWEMRVARSTLDPDFGSDLNLLYNGQYKSMLRAINGEHLNYSDRRLKTNISDMPALLDKFMQLQPVEYEMKYHNSNHIKSFGFIAQDVKKLFPELVVVTTDTSRGYPGIVDLHGLNYNGFTVLTIKALQEQQQLIKNMQEVNKDLAKRIEIAEAAINRKTE